MRYYVFVRNAGDGYTVGQAGTAAVADAIPVSRPYTSLSLAHDNMLHRQHMPLNERQRAEIAALQARYGMGAARGTERNQTFFDARQPQRDPAPREPIPERGVDVHTAPAATRCG
jgi:hypothetical protein